MYDANASKISQKSFLGLVIRLLLAVSLIVFSISVPAASGATVATDKPCYASTFGSDLTFTASGLYAKTYYRVYLDGVVDVNASGYSDTSGVLSGSLGFNALADKDGYSLQHILTIKDLSGYSVADTTFVQAQKGVSPYRSRGKASKRVKVRVSGLEVGERVYAHYYRSGVLRKTLKLGVSKSASGCGLLQTKLKLGYKKKVAKGSWDIYIDNSSTGKVDTSFSFAAEITR